MDSAEAQEDAPARTGLNPKVRLRWPIGELVLVC
jgi:hypothetical protein